MGGGRSRSRANNPERCQVGQVLRRSCLDGRQRPCRTAGGIHRGKVPGLGAPPSGGDRLFPALLAVSKATARRCRTGAEWEHPVRQ